MSNDGMTWKSKVNFIKRLFLILFLVGIIPLMLLYGAKKAVIILLLVMPLYLIFVLFHFERELIMGEYELNMKNKDPKKGFVEYQMEIEEFLISLNYQLLKEEGTFKEFSPRQRQRVMGGNIIIERNPYWIKIKGPKGMVSIIQLIIEKDQVGLGQNFIGMN